MIVETLPNNRPMNFSILAQQTTAQVVNLPTQVNKGDFCWCQYYCEDTQLLLAGDNATQNDRASILFKRLDPANSLVIELYKNDVLVDTISDNTYGDFYDFGTLANTNLSGFILDAKKVFDLLGGGYYQLKSTLTMFGIDYDFETITYEIKPYSQELADKTVRVEYFNNGIVERDNIDFRGVNWLNQIRISGTAKNIQPEFITENYQDNTRKINQVQDKISNLIEVEFRGLSDSQKDQLVYQMTLANEIKLICYNIDNPKRYEIFNVYPEKFDSLTYRINREGANLIMTFRDKQDNILKRNYTY